MAPSTQSVDRGKPAEYGQEIVKRRSRITSGFLPLSGLKILDFGCGNGAQTVELIDHRCRVTACDIDADDLEVLRQYITQRGIDSISPVRYDGFRLPFPDAEFDICVSYAVLEHVTDEDLALREIWRILKPGGSLVISVPNKWWVFETHGARLPLLPWNRVPFFSWLPGSIHRRFAKARIYRKKEFQALLLSHGFDLIESCYMAAPMDVVRPAALQRLLRGTIFRTDRTRVPLLATEIFAYCRKMS